MRMKVDAWDIAIPFLQDAFLVFGMPDAMTMDRDPRFSTNLIAELQQGYSHGPDFASQQQKSLLTKARGLWWVDLSTNPWVCVPAVTNLQNRIIGCMNEPPTSAHVGSHHPTPQDGERTLCL